MKEKINNELDRLSEIYTILFPNEKSLVLVELVTNNELTPAREISVKNAADLIQLGNSKFITLETGTQNTGCPSRFFLVRFSLDPSQSYTTSQSILPLGLKWKLISKLRNTLSSHFALTYEIIKALYLNRLEKTVLSYRRLPNRRNPKNKLDSKPQTSKLLIAMHWLDVGGAEAFAVECCKLANALNQSLTIVVSHISRPYYLEALIPLGKVYELDRQIPENLRTIFLTELVSIQQVSVIHNHHNQYIYESLPLIRLRKPDTQVIDTLHIDEKNRFSGGFPRISIVWANYIDYHHVISSRLKDMLISHGIHSQRVLFGHLGKNLKNTNGFSIIDSLKSSRLTFCFVGRMTGQKRPLLAAVCLIYALKYCKHKNITTSVNVIGDGFYLSAFKSVVKRSHLESSFIFHPSNTNVNTIMEKSDILLISSENEGITLVGYEAFRNGCLVVSTDVGAQGELVPGLLLIPSNPLKALISWKSLIKNIVTNQKFLVDAINEFHQKAESIASKPSAEEVILRLYKGIQ